MTKKKTKAKPEDPCDYSDDVAIHLEPMDLSEGIRGDLTDPVVAHTYITACLDQGLSLHEAMEEIMKAYSRPPNPWIKAN